MTIVSSLPFQILEAQTEVLKAENRPAENIFGMAENEKGFVKRSDGVLCFGD